MRSPIPILVLCLAAALSSARANVTPAALFRDHAVLQQGMEIPVWGTAEEGEKVAVTLGDRTVSTEARQGRWSVRLPAIKAGGPYTLTIQGRNRVVVSDVLIGEVWLCGGQSNMERQLGPRPPQKPLLNWENEAASANFPQIREFAVPQKFSAQPQQEVGGQWSVCTPTNVINFSAVGFFFGRALHEARHVPIGLIHSSYGGTPAEAWMSAEGLAPLHDFDAALQLLHRYEADPAGAQAEYERVLTAWFEANDVGTRATPAWSVASLDTAEWRTMRLPTLWEDAGLPNFDGVVWFRREFTLPDDWAGQDAELHLGAIDDADTTWVNGQQVGQTDGWDKLRVYRVSGSMLHPGRNTVSVRVSDAGGGGGLWGHGDRLALTRTDGRRIELDGEWRYRVSLDFAKTPRPPASVANTSGAPTVLYNAMIAPLEPYALRGVIWYQGEANADRAVQYQTLFPALVADWRRVWGRDFPFLYVQIAPFNGMPPEIREAQLLSLPKTRPSAMVVTTDVGDAEDIHPANKRPVGERLALAARAIAYGEKIVYSGPLYQSVRFDGPRAIVSFTEIGGGLQARDGELKGFTLAGEDGIFHAATARISGDTVEVTAEGVTHPTAVRYGWANVPDGNLFNRAGLPASPFRSDR
jgi:sialate O-acetylesterase